MTALPLILPGLSEMDVCPDSRVQYTLGCIRKCYGREIRFARENLGIAPVLIRARAELGVK
jgi:hypothetical protein